MLNAIATHTCKTQLQSTITKLKSKTQLQHNNIKTTIEKQQLLQKILAALRGTPPGSAKKH